MLGGDTLRHDLSLSDQTIDELYVKRVGFWSAVADWCHGRYDRVFLTLIKTKAAKIVSRF